MRELGHEQKPENFVSLNMLKRISAILKSEILYWVILLGIVGAISIISSFF